MKAKILALIAAAALTVTMFAGCGGDSSSSTAGGTDSSASGEVPREEVNLTWYLPYDVPADSAPVYEKLNQMSKEKLNTTVDFKFANGEKAELMVTTNETYDMVFTCSWHNNYGIQARRGFFADLTDVIPKVAPDLNEYVSESCWESYSVDGKIYAVPSYKDVAASFIYMLSEDIATKADLMTEWEAVGSNIETAYPLIEKLQKYINETGPLASGANNAAMSGAGGYVPVHNFDPIDYTYGGGLVYPHSSTDGKILHRLENPDIVAGIKFAKKLWDGGMINKDAATSESVPEGAFGTMQAYPSFRHISTNFGLSLTKLKEEPIYTTSYAQSAAQGISVNSPNVERAVEYLQYANLDEEYRDILGFGLEGTHWNKTETGTIKRTDKGTNGYNPWTWAQGAFFTLTEVDPEPFGNWDKVKDSMDTAPAGQYNGFIFDGSMLETEKTTLNTIWNKYSVRLQLGDVDDVDATIEKILKEMNEAGLTKVLEEVNKQGATFLATK